MYSDNSIEITYTVFGFDEAGETSFDMDVSDHLYNKLQDAEDEGEMLAFGLHSLQNHSHRGHEDAAGGFQGIIAIL